MTTALEIGIGGLCMFVPDGPHLLHTLMPVMPEAAEGGMAHPPHTAMLIYDRANLRDDPSTTSCLDYVDLGGHVVVVGRDIGEATASVDPRKVAVLANSEHFTGVDRACVGVDAARRVTARLELRAGRAVEYLASCDSYRSDVLTLGGRSLRDDPEPLATNVVWCIPDVGDAADASGAIDLRRLIELNTLDGAPSPQQEKLPALRSNGDGSAWVYILYVDALLRPVNCTYPPTRVNEALHFSAFYGLGVDTGDAHRMHHLSEPTAVTRNVDQPDSPRAWLLPRCPGKICTEVQAEFGN